MGKAGNLSLKMEKAGNRLADRDKLVKMKDGLMQTGQQFTSPSVLKSDKGKTGNICLWKRADLLTVIRTDEIGNKSLASSTQHSSFFTPVGANQGHFSINLQFADESRLSNSKKACIQYRLCVMSLAVPMYQLEYIYFFLSIPASLNKEMRFFPKN
jgi:hypothetical protein